MPHYFSPQCCRVSPSPRVWTAMSSGPKSPGCLILKTSFLYLCVFCLSSVESFIFQNGCDELVLVSRRRLLFSLNHSIFLTPPNMSPSYPTHSLDCATTTYASILCGCRDLLSSFLCVGHATHAVLLHLYTFFKESITAFGSSSQTHSMARHILSAIFSFSKGKPLLFVFSS